MKWLGKDTHYIDSDGNYKVCECGCGERIVVHPHHKYRRIPEYVHGHAGRNMSNETRRKIADASIGRIHKPESIRKMVIAKTGKKMSEEAKHNMSVAQTGKKHTEETKRRMSEARTGMIINPSLTDEDRKNRRRSPEYKQWSQSVFERDNYTCQCCGKRGVTLNAHHIRNWADNPDLRYDVDNGITTCYECHLKKDVGFHSLFGVKNNTPGQIWAYMLTRRSLGGI